ncbi:hypothetical protein [Paramagnetospirillum kuznetsovii]|uniref:hypothetical protein n=1 Tax=Paramagnetospirillum kuznetsovii TaxID=2053833 RepID=UPI001864EF1C|nr:hypothetical protein [Paramagnetospirillum kuznetsovii]
MTSSFAEAARAMLEQARLTKERVTLVSPPAAAGWQGIGWWLATVDALARQCPDQAFDAVLDCGAAPGHALAALRAGVKAVRLDASPETLRAVGEIATALGSTLLDATWRPERPE